VANEKRVMEMEAARAEKQMLGNLAGVQVIEKKDVLIEGSQVSPTRPASHVPRRHVEGPITTLIRPGSKCEIVLEKKAKIQKKIRLLTALAYYWSACHR
jgi:hypothetical protein